MGLVRCGVADTPLHTLRGLESPSQFGLFWAPHLFWTPPDEAIKAGSSTPTVVQECSFGGGLKRCTVCNTHRHDGRNTTRKEMASPDINGRPLALHTQLRPIAFVQPYCGTFVGCLRLLVVSPSATKMVLRWCTAVLPKFPHCYCCKRDPNRPLRPRGIGFGTLLELCAGFLGQRL